MKDELILILDNGDRNPEFDRRARLAFGNPTRVLACAGYGVTGLQHIGMAQDADRRLHEHRKGMPVCRSVQLGDPAVGLLISPLDFHVACVAERRDIMAWSAMTLGAALLRRRSRGVQEGLRAAWQELLDPAKAR